MPGAPLLFIMGNLLDRDSLNLIVRPAQFKIRERAPLR